MGKVINWSEMLGLRLIFIYFGLFSYVKGQQQSNEEQHYILCHNWHITDNTYIESQPDWHNIAQLHQISLKGVYRGDSITNWVSLISS